MNPSYGYVYDAALSEKRFEKELAVIENQLNSYDLFGRVCRLALFRAPQEAIVGMAKQGVKTLVIVGTDDTLIRMFPIALAAGLTVGFIPCGGPSSLGNLLNIPHGKKACDVLAARRVEVMDIGEVNLQPFLVQVLFPANEASLEVEGRYRVSTPDGGWIRIQNAGGGVTLPYESADARDGRLEAVIEPKAKNGKLRSLFSRQAPILTRIFFERADIVAKQTVEVLIDGIPHTAERFRFSIRPGVLPFITGRRGSALPKPEEADTFRVASGHAVPGRNQARR